MGRRSISTTKSGKYMNPTDQARKEARKKELKKNKKQRQMVRAAVLKGKDPTQLLEEMEKIDEMEYNVYQPSPLNEKVLKEKRKKLRETFDRVMRLYHNEDPDLWGELKRKEMDFEKRRNKIIQFYESVKHAQTVQIDDIPLPQMSENEQPPSSANAPSAPNRTPAVSMLPNIELPVGVQQPFTMPGFATANQRKRPLDKLPTADDRHASDLKSPPGCPPGPPPNLSKMRELDSDYEDDGHNRLTSKFGSKLPPHSDADHDIQVPGDKTNNDVDVRKPTSVQQRILAIAGQRYDDFMKELENVHKINKSKSSNINEPAPSDNDDGGNDPAAKPTESFAAKKIDDHFEEGVLIPTNEQMMMPPFDAEGNPIPHPLMVPSMAQMLKLPSGPPPPPMGMPPTVMYRPPPIRPGHPGMGMRLPPGMPRIRMPPGPPTSMPPNRMMHGHHKPPHLPQLMHNTLSAAPQLIKDTKGMTTITAKPQIRNLSADVTRFVPSALRVKREEKKISKPKPFVSEYRKQSEATTKGTTKDDAYMQFMREMQGLL